MTDLLSTSVVYNFRIAQITKQPFANSKTKHHHTLIALLFEIYQKKYNGPTQNFFGELTGYIYDFDPYFFRTDFAFAHINSKTNLATNFTGTQTDDLLFTFGRNFHVNSKNSVTLSGLFGVPTHQNTYLLHPSFGYGQIGFGVQLDGIYEFNQNSALIYGARYIYFVPNHAYNNNCDRYKITAGNTNDFLIASKYNWGPKGVEFGYTAKFEYGANAKPYIANYKQQANFIRSNLYFVYKYKFTIHELPNRVLFNIAFGRDHKNQTFSNKAIMTIWGAWNINF